MWTEAIGLNNNGDIAGSFADASGIHGFVRSAGSYTAVNYPGAAVTRVGGINDNGDIVGVFRQVAGEPLVAFGRVKGEFVAIRVPCAGNIGGALDINGKGDIAGNFIDGDGRIRWGFVVSDINKAKKKDK